MEYFFHFRICIIFLRKNRCEIATGDQRENKSVMFHVLMFYVFSSADYTTHSTKLLPVLEHHFFHIHAG